MHERERALEIRIMQIRIIGAELVGEEHALVDRSYGTKSKPGNSAKSPLAAAIQRLRDGLAQDVEAALEFVFATDLRAARR